VKEEGEFEILEREAIEFLGTLLIKKIAYV